MTRVATLVLLVLIAGSVTAMPAAGGPRVRLSADRSTVTIGQERVVDVLVEDAPSIYGADVQIAFDPKALEVVDADAQRSGTQIAQGEFVDATKSFTLQHSVDSEAGQIHYAVTLMNPAPAVEGAGTLARIVFRGKSRGETKVTVRQGHFGTRDGVVLRSDIAGLELAVVEPGETWRPAIAGATRDLARKAVSVVGGAGERQNRWQLIAAAMIVVLALLVGCWFGQRA